MPINSKNDISLYELLTIFISVLSLAVAGFAIYLNLQADTPKLSIETETGKCLNGSKPCYRMFVYNNDDAPCFEFKLQYKESFGQGYYVKGYENSRLFDSTVSGRTIAFPPMTLIPLDKDSTSSVWLGFLDNKEVAHFVFVPHDGKLTKNQLTVRCVGYNQSVIF